MTVDFEWQQIDKGSQENPEIRMTGIPEGIKRFLVSLSCRGAVSSISNLVQVSPDHRYPHYVRPKSFKAPVQVPIP